MTIVSSSGSGPGITSNKQHLGNTSIKGELESSRIFYTVLEGSFGGKGERAREF